MAVKPFVSSYALAKPGSPWDRDGEAALFEGLGRLDLAGLELGFTGRLHEHDDGWLLDRLRPEWSLSLTLLPGTMDRLKDDAAFGLASADGDGRKRALDFAGKARRTVEHLNRFLGRPAVRAVAVHSAPRLGGGARSSLEGFADSLSVLRSWDWAGAELLVEHCDAALPDRPGDKRFLRVEDECAALGLSKGTTPARMLVNWGRSAVETRSDRGPVEHIRRCREAGLLAGLFFSGTSPEDADYGAWKDSHAPFSVTRPSSILTIAAAKEALAQAGDFSYLGLKIQPLPAAMGTEERLLLLRANLDALQSAVR